MPRPEKWRDEFIRITKQACQLGATDIEIADFLQVSVRTLNYWKAQKPEFAKAVEIAKIVADDRVERSLYHRAIGYTFKSEKVFQFQGSIVRTDTIEHVPPDPTSCIFWLKNRRPKDWRDVHRHEIGEPGEFERLNDNQLIDALREDARKLGIAPPPLAISKTEH